MCDCTSQRETLLFGLPKREHIHRCAAGSPPLRRRDWLALAGSAFTAMLAAPARLAAAVSGRTTTYDFVSSGTVKGSQVTTVLPDGSLDVAFEYIDRGRGPKYRSVISLDAAGFITNLRTTGYDYLKGPVDERFAATPKGTSWKNVAESETVPTSDSRFYVSINGSPEESAALARALLRASGPLALWPAGIATIERISSLPVTHGAATHNVTLYEIGGLDFVPTMLWLDGDASLFMYGSIWGAVVSTGWATVLPQLFAAQDERDAARGRKIALTLPQRSSTSIAITNCTLFDSEAGSVVPRATLLLNGDRIAAIGDSSLPIPSDARRIDGTDKTVLPGLWNMHMHLSSSFGPRLLAEGVTTVRDPGNNPDYIEKLQKQYASGELIGPRVIIAGLMDGKGKYTAPIGTTTDNAAEAVTQVRDWKKRGAVQIKMYSSLDPHLVPIVANEAHRLGMRVSGHIPAGMLAQDAIEAGFDEIQHINFLFLNFMPDVKDATQTPVRLTVPTERAGTIDLHGPDVRNFISLLKRHQTVLDPTLVTFYTFAYQRPGDLASGGFGDVAQWLPPQVRRGLLAGSLPVPPGKDAAYRASGDAYLKMIALMHANGIPIVAGSDDVLVGFDTIRELVLYAKAGIPTAQALQAATIVPARVMKMDATLGSLKPGKIADAIVVHGNPLDDISQLRRVGTTIKSGVIYDTRALYASAGVTAPALV